ncbi:hypothetical protein MPSEU_001068800 [Mayamaea pseudoterrestris]|nr:hypothetical protein MPSEU_001068800 [Mayamaea pseudoterrestris]
MKYHFRISKRIFSLLASLAMAASLTPTGRKTTEAANSTSAYLLLSPADVYNGMQNGTFGALLDVRTEVDWSTTSRLPNSTSLSELFASGRSLNGCEYCDIVVYGDTFLQVEQALDAFVVANFRGKLYNGQTLADFQNAGYKLVMASSVVPSCAATDSVAEESFCYTAWEESQENGVSTQDDDMSSTTAAPTFIRSIESSPTNEPEQISAIQGGSDTSAANQSLFTRVALWSTVSCLMFVVRTRT